MMTTEHIFAAHKANVETLLGLTAKAFEGVEKLVELNVNAAKSAMAESAQTAQTALSAKDAQELLAMQARLLQPLAEKTAQYSRQLYDIASHTGGDLAQALQGQAHSAQQQWSQFVDSAAAQAPGGSEAAVAMMKGAVTAAGNAFETVQNAVKQATDLAESNMAALAQQVPAAAAAAKPAKKR